MKTLILILFLFQLLNACKIDSKPDNYNTESKEQIDLSIVSDREYTKDELAKFKLANKRFHEKLELENGTPVLKAKNGDEIGIPNEFFYFFKMALDYGNKCIPNSSNTNDSIESELYSNSDLLNEECEPEYIDIPIVSDREYTIEEIEKYGLLSERFYQNVEIENGIYVIKAKSGDEIGIPNEFFYIYKMLLDDSNEYLLEAQKTGKDIKPLL